MNQVLSEIVSILSEKCILSLLSWGGGIYASLLPHHFLEFCDADYVCCGTVEEIDKVKPAYHLIDTDTQILQSSRGCIRKCGFCGTYKIEPQFSYKRSIWHEVCKKRVIFYDNNLLANPYIENILDEMIRLRRHKKIHYIEAQSGIDARLLTKTIATKLYKAGFKNITFAWDGKYEDKETIDRAIQLLTGAGYNPRDIRAFILYNYDVSYLECEEKRVHLFKRGLQVMPCRYIPLTSTRDGYNPYLKSQSSSDYYIHMGWTDAEVRMFKRNCRQHNICIRFRWNFYSSKAEHKAISLDEVERLQGLSSVEARGCGCFDPSLVRFV